jgi:hypothetical protein
MGWVVDCFNQIRANNANLHHRGRHGLVAKVSDSAWSEHHGFDTHHGPQLLVTLGKSLYFDCFILWTRCKTEIPCTCRVSMPGQAQGVNV